MSPFSIHRAIVMVASLALGACVTGAGGGGGVYTGASGGAASSGGTSSGASSSGGSSTSGASSGGSSSGGSSSGGASSGPSSAALYNFGPVKIVDWDQKDGSWVADKDHNLMKYDASGKLLEVVQINHDEAGKPVKDDVQRFEYDANGRVARVLRLDHNNEKGPVETKGRWVASRFPDGLLKELLEEHAVKEDPECQDTASEACAVKFVPEERITYAYDSKGRLARVESKRLKSAIASYNRYEFLYDGAGNMTRWRRSKVSDDDSEFTVLGETRIVFQAGKPVSGGVWERKNGQLSQAARVAFKAASDGRLLEELIETKDKEGAFKPSVRTDYSYNGVRLTQRSRFRMKDGAWTETDRDTIEHGNAGSSFTFERDVISTGGGAWSVPMVTYYGRVLAVRVD